MAKKKKKTKKEERTESVIKLIKGIDDKYTSAIKSLVLFGSAARGEENENSDIDVLVIVDDTDSVPFERVEKSLLRLDKTSDKISLEVIRLVDFWNGVRLGSPVIINMIRDGDPIHDTGMFHPLKRLLEMGAITPSIEMIERYRDRVPKRIERIKGNKMIMVFEDCFYAFVESASVPIILSGLIPPKPEDTSKVLRSIMRKLKIKGINIKNLDEIMKLRKKFKYKKIEEVTGIDLDIWLSKAEGFIKEMNDLSLKIENIKLDVPLSGVNQ
jgi:predicted nucleotidyltransferase